VRLRPIMGSVPGDPGLSAGEHCDAGVALYRQGRNAEAEAAFRAAIRLDPGSSPAHGNLARLLWRAGQKREAEAAYREAVRADPGSSVAHSDLGDVLLATGRYPQAEAAYREAIRLERTNVRARNGLGQALEGSGQQRKAWAVYRELSRMRPDINPWTLTPIHDDDQAQREHIRRQWGKRPPQLGGPAPNR
jgi:tetratricopeptide (TPR) repeat protein